MTYREVIRPPWWVYAVPAGLVALFCFTFAAVITPPAALVLFFVLFGLAAFTVWRRRLELSVDDARLRIGRESLPLADIGEVTALDEPALRLAAGPQADPRAHLVLRNLATKQGVKIEVTSGDTPYWLVSSGHPQELVHALQAR